MVSAILIAALALAKVMRRTSPELKDSIRKWAFSAIVLWAFVGFISAAM